MPTIEKLITSRERDIGGLTVRRILPYVAHRTVGPFIFFDHMGPAEFTPGAGMDVRPHPHINLATVTYLFEGRIQHRDSLGSNIAIEPGAINWMTAGRGIVHSERTPEPERSRGSHMNGIQCWIALPVEKEETHPAFSHHPKESLPEFEVDGARLKLLLGTAFGHTSPVPVHSDLFYLDVKLAKGSRLALYDEAEREAAFYVAEGSVVAAGRTAEPYTMSILAHGGTLELEAISDTRLMLLGGKPLGRRDLYWNFASSSKARLEEAKEDWRKGPRPESSRFQPIPGDDREFIPLPDTPDRNPKGTIM